MNNIAGKTFFFILAIAAAAWIAAGCGGGSITVKGLGANPAATATSSVITGSVIVPGDLALSREAGGGLDRSASLTSEKPLPSATVGVYTMGADGSLTAVSAIPTTTTNSSGAFSIPGAVEGVHYIIKATLAAGVNTITVHGVATVSSSSYGSSVAAGDIDAETTFAVEGLRKSVAAYNVGKTGSSIKLLSAFSTTDVNNMINLCLSNLQAQVTAGNVSITNVLTNSTTLATQFASLQAKVPSLDTLVSSLSGAAPSDTTAPTVSSFSPANAATNVPADGAAFKVVFSESMKTSVDLNTQATLTASGFTISLQRADTGGTITINAANALNYGTFAWTTTTAANDTLSFTLKSNSALRTAGLKILYPGKTYNITARTVPTNLQDAAGNALSSTGIASTGSFTVTADTTAPTVSSFSPADGATNVPSNSPVFKVIFNETMDDTVNLNVQSTLTASGFSVTLQRQDTGVSLTINTANALNYGSFSWTQTTLPQDTLSFTLKSNSALAYAGLKTIAANKTYNITNRTVPTNLKDYSGNVLSTSGIASTGSFTAASDTTAPQVYSFSPATGAANVPNNSPVFMVIFNESMDNTINLNNQSTLTASGFSITLQRWDTGGSLTINAANALNYGSFSWTMTAFPQDTLSFTLKSNSELAAAGLKAIAAGKTYHITSRTVPTNLKDYSGNALSDAGIFSSGMFTTLP